MFLMIIRLLIIYALIVAIFLGMSYWDRMKKRNLLEAKYEASDKDSDHDTYIKLGMAKYDRSLRAKKYLLLFFIPFIIAIAIYIKSKY